MLPLERTLEHETEQSKDHDREIHKVKKWVILEEQLVFIVNKGKVPVLGSN